MSRWRWTTNLPYRFDDPPTPHIPTVPAADVDRARLDDGHDFVAGVSGRQPRNRSKRFPEQAGEQR